MIMVLIPRSTPRAGLSPLHTQCVAVTVVPLQTRAPPRAAHIARWYDSVCARFSWNAKARTLRMHGDSAWRRAALPVRRMCSCANAAVALLPARAVCRSPSADHHARSRWRAGKLRRHMGRRRLRLWRQRSMQQCSPRCCSTPCSRTQFANT